MGRELFGTDGVRGVAGAYPLDPRTVHAIGAALGRWCRDHSADPVVLIGMDTRESGPWIAAQVAGGLAREGVRARSAGLISTPGVAYLTRNDEFVAGVMISASHNAYLDNGIKVFGHSGYKLPDSEEEDIEKTVFAILAADFEPVAKPVPVEENLDLRYLDFLVHAFEGTLEGMTMVLDCGNGAAVHLAPAAFQRLGAKVHTIGCEPNGRNINLDCGALHVDALAAKVVEFGADLGFAFDGDADRCIAVSRSGRIVDGDAILLACARRMQQQGLLHGGAVVATVMSNLGLERALRSDGIGLIRTPVGDKYVLEEMRRQNMAIGGEQSGHVIFLDQATTGDGLLTALRLTEAVRAAGRPLEDLVADLEVYPQKLVNVRVKERRPLQDLIAVAEAIRKAEESLGTQGRVLVRFSGTEPLARVMVEGPTDAEVERHASDIAAAIRTELGG